MCVSVEGQQVVFAQAVELDGLDDDHFVILDIEESAIQDGFRVHGVSAEQFVVHLRDPDRRSLGALLVYVLRSDSIEH